MPLLADISPYPHICARVVTVASEELSEPDLEDLVHDAVRWA